MEDNKDNVGGKLSKKEKRDAGVSAEHAVHNRYSKKNNGLILQENVVGMWGMTHRWWLNEGKGFIWARRREWQEEKDLSNENQQPRLPQKILNSTTDPGLRWEMLQECQGWGRRGERGERRTGRVRVEREDDELDRGHVVRLVQRERRGVPLLEPGRERVCLARDRALGLLDERRRALRDSLERQEGHARRRERDGPRDPGAVARALGCVVRSGRRK